MEGIILIRPKTIESQQCQQEIHIRIKCPFGNNLFSILLKKIDKNALKYTCTLKKFEKVRKKKVLKSCTKKAAATAHHIGTNMNPTPSGGRYHLHPYILYTQLVL